MAIPLLFIGIAAVTGAVGIGKNIKGGVDNSKAKSINKDANSRINEAGEALDVARKQCGDALDDLGLIKLNVLDENINLFIKHFEQLKNVELEDSIGLDELSKFHVDKKGFTELKEMGSYATSLVKGSLAGATGGALAAFGAYSAATTFATASTGTAIASLSGAAATNATLAFFGGGSIAAGGLGIAGGTAVLGGLVAGPALLVMGVITGANASKNLENAYSNLAKAKEICEQLETAKIQCDAIRRRTYMFYYLLSKCDAQFLPLIYEMEQVIEKEGTDYSKYSTESKNVIAKTVTMAGTIKAILDTPILTESGEMTKESETLVDEISKEFA